MFTQSGPWDKQVRVSNPTRWLTSAAAIALVLGVAACGGARVVQAGSPTSGSHASAGHGQARTTTAPTSTVAARGRAEAVAACQRWAAAGKGSGSNAQSAHAAQALAAREGMRAAAADASWTKLADAMTGSVRLPLAMLTPSQESAAAADLATVRTVCARLGVAVARS